MKELNQNDLEKVQGGFGIWAAFGIGVGIVFFIGFLDGLVNPQECNN